VAAAARKRESGDALTVVVIVRIRFAAAEHGRDDALELDARPPE
jgi:hypothetical protein